LIGLVTDSNSQLTPELRERFAVQVVPLTVVVDGQPYREGVDLDLAGITAALDRRAALGTSTPSPGDFLEAYERAAASGATRVLSIHAGGAVSGTANTARLAAGLASVSVEVVDTGTASFPVTLCLWAAGEALASGGSLEQAAAAARRTAPLVGNVFVVGTLGLAARGGRLAAGVDASGIPVLALADGAMTAVGQVTDVGQAVDAMADHVVNAADGARLRVGVGHLAAMGLADSLEAALRERCQIEELVRYDVGPSVAVHTGLGTVGCVFHPV
jgi:DegV family protein with EDD domain